MQLWLLVIHIQRNVSSAASVPIYLSTRILVCSARPGRILREICVPFGATRALDIKLTPEFMQLKREIIELLHHEQHNGFDREQLLRKLVENRMASVF